MLRAVLNSRLLKRPIEVIEQRGERLEDGDPLIFLANAIEFASES